MGISEHLSGQGRSSAYYISSGEKHTFKFKHKFCLTEVKYLDNRDPSQDPGKDKKITFFSWKTMPFSLGTDLPDTIINKHINKLITLGTVGGFAGGGTIAATTMAATGTASAIGAAIGFGTATIAAVGAIAAGAAIVGIGAALGGIALAYKCRDLIDDYGILLYQKTDRTLCWTITKWPALSYMLEQTRLHIPLRIDDTKHTNTFTFYNITGKDVWIEPQMGDEKIRRHIANGAQVAITVKRHQCLANMNYKFQQVENDPDNSKDWNPCPAQSGIDLLEQKRILTAPMTDTSQSNIVNLTCGDQRVVVYNSNGTISWTIVTPEDAQKLIGK